MLGHETELPSVTMPDQDFPFLFAFLKNSGGVAMKLANGHNAHV